MFIPAVGEYVIPSLLGRTDQLMIAKLLSDEFFLNRDWPRASAVAIVMLLLLVVPIMIFQHFQNKELRGAEEMKTQGMFSKTMLAFGFAVPVRAHLLPDRVLLQRLALGDGVELRHFADAEMVLAPDLETSRSCPPRGCPSRWRRCRRRGAVILGTLAGLVLARFGPFQGPRLPEGLTTAPLVMPEVITGLSMLLLFVSLEQLLRCLVWLQFDRGIITITIAHITFTMAYVTVVVQSRLASFDDSLEEAALDLGARPAQRVLPHHRSADPARHPVWLAAGLYTFLG